MVLFLIQRVYSSGIWRISVMKQHYIVVRSHFQVFTAIRRCLLDKALGNRIWEKQGGSP